MSRIISPLALKILRLQKEGDEKNKNELDLLKQFIENKIKEIEAQLELLMRTPLKSGKSIRIWSEVSISPIRS